MSTRRLFLALASLAATSARPDGLVVKTFDYQASNRVVQCVYAVDWPVGGLSTQVVQRLRTSLLTDAWATPDHQARNPGDNPAPHLVRRATLFAEGRAGLDEEAGPSAAWEERAKLEFLGACGAVMVYRNDSWEYTGGAHGNGAVDYLVYDSSGARVPSSAWFVPGSEGALSKLIEAAFRVQKGLAPEAKLGGQGFFEDHIPPSGVIRPTREGMEFLYNSYEISPYSEGRPAVTLPWAQVRPHLTGPAKEWLTGVLP
ncbi:MAG: RsiV family protein [Kiritimatiellia bacterium]